MITWITWSNDEMDLRLAFSINTGKIVDSFKLDYCVVM
jgi:hypothetical protein